MSAGMAEVLVEHELTAAWLSVDAPSGFICLCGAQHSGTHPELTPRAAYAAHVAEELAKAGYGNVADAWDEGATAGWKQSGEGFNAEYPDESTGECSVDLSANPYREASHGVD